MNPLIGNRLERERRDAEIKKRERDEQHLYLTTKVSYLVHNWSILADSDFCKR